MGTLEEWEQKIEAREQNIVTAFFEYAWDNELPFSILLIISQGKYYEMNQLSLSTVY